MTKQPQPTFFFAIAVPLSVHGHAGADLVAGTAACAVALAAALVVAGAGGIAFAAALAVAGTGGIAFTAALAVAGTDGVAGTDRAAYHLALGAPDIRGRIAVVIDKESLHAGLNTLCPFTMIFTSGFGSLAFAAWSSILSLLAMSVIPRFIYN
jgi:hypothetical protein